MDVGFKILRDGNSSITGYSDTFAYDFESLGVTITSTSIFYYDTSFKLTSVENYLNSGPTTTDVIVSSLTITRSGGDLVELGETYSGGDTSNPVSSYEYTYNASTGAFQGGFTIDDGGLKTVYSASWEVLSQTQSVGALSQLSSADGIAFTLFDAAYYDADTYTASGEKTTITSYFQADGALLGTSNTIETLDGPNNVVSTYTSFSNKDWVFIGEEYSDATSSQWRTITKQADLDDRDDGADFIIVDTSEFSVGNSVQSHETSFYSYDSTTFVGDQYLGGESLQDGVTTVFDASGRIESATRDVSALSSVSNPSSAYDLFSDGGTEDVKFESVPWVEPWGSGIETTYYIDGRVVGTSSTWGDTNYSDTSYYDADGQFLRSEWSDQYGNEGWNESTLVIDAGDQNENGLTTDYIRVEKGYNKWTWDDGSGGTASDTSEYTWYYDASTWEFLGGHEASGSGLVTTYNSDWTIASSARDVSGVTDVLAEGTFDGVAYKIFGAAKYIETDSWSDSWGEGSTYEFYNASDELLGTQSFSKWSWDDANVAGGKASSENYSFQDAKGEWLGSSWSDSYNNKGSNFVSEDYVLATDAVAIALEANGDVNFVDVTIGSSTVSVVDFDKNGSGDIVRIEEGSNTWVDSTYQEGTTTKTEGSTYTRYYPKDGWDMLGGSETMNGQETIYGKHWTVLSSKVDSAYWDLIKAGLADITDVSLSNYDAKAKTLFKDATLYEVTNSDSWTDANGTNSNVEITYYDDSGNKIGTKWESHWGADDSNVSYQDSNGVMLQSEWYNQWGSGWNASKVDYIRADSDAAKALQEHGDVNFVDVTIDGATVSVVDFDKNGSGDEVRIDSGGNSWTWNDGVKDITEQSTYNWFYANDNSWNFLGGDELMGSEYRVYNQNWNTIKSSQQVDTSNTQYIDSSSTDPDEKVLYEIFKGGAGSDGKVYYTEDGWGDQYNQNGERTFFDQEGEILGYGSYNRNSWDNGGKLEWSENWNIQDENWMNLASRWSDSNGNEGWSKTVEDFVLATDAVAIALEANGDVNFVDVTIGSSTVSVVDFDKNGSGDIVRIEEGSNTWSWQEGTTTKTESSTYTRYYPKDGWDMLGGSETMNSQETIYGKHWTVLSSKVDSTYWDLIKAGLADITDVSLSNYDAKAVTLFSEATLYEIGYSHSDGTNSEIEIIYYDDSGNQVGSKWANSWNGGSNVNYHDNNGNQISSSWSNSDGNSGFNSSIKDYILATDDVAKALEARGDVSFVNVTIGGATVSVVDFDKDGVADKVRIETNENVWPYIDGNETKYDTRTTINYYELEDSSMPAGGKMLGGIENDGDEVRLFGKDYELISSKLASFTLSDYLDTDDQTKPHYLPKAEELFGATSVYKVDDEWSDGNGNLNVNLTYFDEVGNVLGEYVQNAWSNGQESEIRYQDANFNTLYSKWTNSTGYTERVRAKETDVLDLDGDGSKTDSIIVETENRVESGSLTIRKSYYVDSTGNMPGNNFIGESETTVAGTTYRDSNWRQVDSLADLQLAAPLTLNVAATPTVDSKQFYDAVDKTGSLVGATGMTNTGTYLFSIAPGNDQFDFYDEDGDGKPNYVVYHVANDSWGMQNSGQTWITSNSTLGAAATAGASVDDSSVSFQLNQSMDNYEFKIGVNANNEVVGLFTSNYLQDLPSITFAISKTPTLEAAPLGYAFADFSDQSGSLLNVTGTGAEGATYKFSVKTSVAQIDFYDTNSDGKVDFALDKWSTDSDGIVQSNVFVNNASTGRISLQDKNNWSEEYFDLVIDSTGDVVGMFLSQEDVTTDSSASASQQTFIDIVDGLSLVSANETVGEVSIVSGDFAVVNILNSGSVPDRAYLVSSAAGAPAPIEISVAQAAAIAEGASNLIPGSQVDVAVDSNNASLGSASEVDGQLLIGLGGNDTLTAASGFDVMIGGEGEDDFVIEPVTGQPAIDNFAMDLIVDLGAGDEVILPAGLTYDANYAAGITQKIKDGGFAALDDGDGNTTIVYDADATSNAVSEAFVLLSDVDSRELDLSSPTIVKADKDQLFKDIVTDASLIDTGNGESIGVVMLVTGDFAMVPVVIANQVDRVYLVSSIAGDSPVAVSLEQALSVTKGAAVMVPGSVVDLGGDASSDALGASINDSGQLLIGLGNDDVLTGASGLDVMIGGAGADDFVIEPVTGALAVDNFAADIIVDFGVGDEIELPTGLTFDSDYSTSATSSLASNKFAAFEDSNGNTTVIYDAGSGSTAIVMLLGVSASHLVTDNNNVIGYI